jgi:hypothetical protein
VKIRLRTDWSYEEVRSEQSGDVSVYGGGESSCLAFVPCWCTKRRVHAAIALACGENACRLAEKTRVLEWVLIGTARLLHSIVVFVGE